MLSPRWVAVVCVVAVLVPSSVYSWPSMPWYECHCPNNAVCASYECRALDFVCTCDECSCFPPEKTLANEVGRLDKDLDMLDKLLGGQYQALFGKK